MNLTHLRSIYMVLCIVIAVSILSPTLARYIVLPHGEPFSELWLLGPNHLADGIPFNISSSKNYSIYVGVTNHMGDFEYYLLYAKLRNFTDSIPNVMNGTATDLVPLTEYRFFLSDNETWERPVTFSVDYTSTGANMSIIPRLSIDGYAFNVDKPVQFDEQNNGYYCELIFELWRYNIAINDFEFHNRFVGIWLNLTQTA